MKCNVYLSVKEMGMALLWHCMSLLWNGTQLKLLDAGVIVYSVMSLLPTSGQFIAMSYIHLFP